MINGSKVPRGDQNFFLEFCFLQHFFLKILKSLSYTRLCRLEATSEFSLRHTVFVIDQLLFWFFFDLLIENFDKSATISSRSGIIPSVFFLTLSASVIRSQETYDTSSVALTIFG